MEIYWYLFIFLFYVLVLGDFKLVKSSLDRNKVLADSSFKIKAAIQL